MQLALPIDDTSVLLEEVHQRLRTRFGQPGPRLRLDPVSQLVLGLIGGRTHAAVSMRAFETMVQRFGSWDRVRDAPVDEVYAAIRAVTFAEPKAVRLQAALASMTAARGALTLDFLAASTVEESLAWLERLPGVGRKAAAATLNFSTLQMPALVIDTHHLRVLRRLGVVGPTSSLVRAWDRVVPRLPSTWSAEEIDDHHQLMKVLGQRFCRHGRPDCAGCPVADLCPRGGGRPAGDGSGRPHDPGVPKHAKVRPVRRPALWCAGRRLPAEADDTSGEALQ